MSRADEASWGPQRAGSYGRNVLISIVAVAAMSLMALVNNIVIARACGPEGRGVYGLAVAIGSLALPIASLGLGQALTWQLGRGHSLAQLLALARRVTAVSIAVALVSLTLVEFAWQPRWDREMLMAVVAAGVALPAQVVVELGRGVALGHRRALAYNLCAAGVIAAFLGLNLITAARGPDWVLGNLVLANYVVALVLGVASLHARARTSVPALNRATIAYGLRSAVVALGDAALLRLEYLIAAPIVGFATLGIYAIADQISHLMAWAGLLAGKMMLPEAASDKAGEHSIAKLGLACRWLITLVLGGALLIIAVGSRLIPALFGSAFAPAYYALLLLLPATLAKGLHALVSTWLQGRGVQRPVVYASAVAVIAEAAAVLVAALSLGWLGVALAKSLAYIIQLGLCVRALSIHRREHGLDDGHWLPGGRWLLGARDLSALRAWLARRTRPANPNP